MIGRTEMEAHSMCASFDRATVNTDTALFYKTNPLPLSFGLRQAREC